MSKTGGSCPLCGEPLFGWLVVPAADGDAGEGYVLDRCEVCGVAVRRDPVPVDLDAELAALGLSPGSPAPGADGPAAIELPNRRSVQGAIGEGRWAAIELPAKRLLHSPTSLGHLLARHDLAVEQIRYPLGAGQLDMLQTLINALTFRHNFARDALARRIHPRGAKERAAYAIDAIVSVLATPLVALISVPLEMVAALLGRGGRMKVSVTRMPPGGSA